MLRPTMDLNSGKGSLFFIFNDLIVQIMVELVFKGTNDQVLTNSLLVAEKFEKNHKDVLEAIRALFVSAENSAQTGNQQLSKMFALSDYEVSLNNGTDATRKNPMYVMNRDGFTLLAMGFTGSKALQFKMDFITAFNKMESMLKSDDYILMRSQQILQKRIEIAEQKALILQAQNEQLAETVTIQSTQLKQAAPKVEYFDNVLQSVNTYTSTQISKEVGFKSADQLHKKLREMKVMYHQSGQWLLTAKYCGKDYTKPRTTQFTRSDGSVGTNTITVWTEAGRMFIHNILKGGKSC